MAQLHPLVVERSTLKDLEREYTLDEIAVLTRVAPAHLLGLDDRGRVTPGRLADLVFYVRRSDWEQTFSQAKSVWKFGEEILRDGRFVSPGHTVSLRSQPRPDVVLGDDMRDKMEQELKVPASMLEISLDEFDHRMGAQGRGSVKTVNGVAT
jgi:formylmethanofuran dehydrogenase subunit A